ncbi:MAG: extracellular solute-binding protein [Rhodospirillales bacterium]|nr:extracellular solute-binding protein [Acetobacter sp.]
MISITTAILVTSEPPLKATTLTIATHYNNEQRAPLTACLVEYEKLHPGTTIIHRQLSYRDILQTVFMARLGGSVPDIYYLADSWTSQLVGSGALAVPPPDIAHFIESQYLKETRESMSSAGRIWGIPAEVAVYMLVYNRQLFTEAGVAQPPGDWNALVEAARRIARSNRQGQLTVSGFAFGPNPAMGVNPFLAMLYSRGQKLFTPDGRGTNLISPIAVDILAGQARLFSTHAVSLEAAPAFFPGGVVGMMIVPNWYKNDLRQSLGEHFTDKVGVAPIPGGPNWRTVQYGFFWAVDAKSPEQRAAWNLLKWLNSPHGANGRSCTGDMLMRLGALTGNRADLQASANELNTAFMKPFVDALSSGRALPLESTPHASEVESLLRSYLEEAWLGMLSPQEALRQADAGIRSILRNTD